MPRSKRKKDKDWLKKLKRLEATEPKLKAVYSYVDLGACAQCDSYEDTLPHDHDEEGNLTVHCEKARGMVPVQVGIDSPEQCPYHK